MRTYRYGEELRKQRKRYEEEMKRKEKRKRIIQAILVPLSMVIVVVIIYYVLQPPPLKARPVPEEPIMEYAYTVTPLSSNLQAHSLLTKGGVDVKFDSNSISTHTKLLVVDDYLTIGGSHNWTMGAFQFNNDSSVLIKSQAVAETSLTHIKSIQQTAVATFPSDPELKK